MSTTLSPSIDCPSPDLGPTAQGIARVAVLDASSQLLVTFERPITPAQKPSLLDPKSYSLTGGERLFPRVISATADPPGTPPDQAGRRVLLGLDGLGDFSVYTLTVNGPGIDPFFSSHALRFRLACDDPFDCRPSPAPPSPAPELPVVIDYLAKDYSSFRQALLDFIPTRLPAWTERSEADIGIMLLELFAATADTLSYMQDRVANEAFLDSATQRRSVAGHLALVGYAMDEGAAALTWLQFQVNSTQPPPTNPGLRVTNRPLRDDEPVIVFETHGTTTLRPEHNAMRLFTWGNSGCCLGQDELSLALVGSYSDLRAGDFLLIDGSAGRRDVVRLAEDPELTPAGLIGSPPDSPPGGMLTVVRWSLATPLHFDYCASEVVVRGNLLPATQGETITESLRSLSAEEKAASSSGPLPARQRLTLSRAPLAHLDARTVAIIGPTTPSPTASFTERSTRGVSTLSLTVEGFTGTWQEVPTLLESGPDDTVFRTEIDDQGDATVVFGADGFGTTPDPTADVSATYRIGGGAVGNVGADVLIVARPRALDSLSWLDSVTNPLPATGGRDLESRDHARRFGPATFQTPLVLVTADDYQRAAQDFTDAHGQNPIQRASASFRWTGSWLTVTLAVDPVGSEVLDPDLRAALLDYLDGLRLAGYDLEITAANYVPVELAIAVCLQPAFRFGDVESALLMALGTGNLPGGRKGFFHPDNFTFGDGLYVSRLYAAVTAVPGVESADITRLARLAASRPDVETAVNLALGSLVIGADQILRLDNDRNFPANGTLSITQKGVGS